MLKVVYGWMYSATRRVEGWDGGANTNKGVSMMILNKQIPNPNPQAKMKEWSPIDRRGESSSKRMLVESPEMLGRASDHFVDQMR